MSTKSEKELLAAVGKLKAMGVTMRVVEGTAPSDADVCRERGWGPGTYLVGDEGYGPTVIKITAVGERGILAKQISHNGKPSDGSESAWTLSCRDWKQASLNEAPR
jgi:hypothetical protein